jgi:hypothetical protein
VVISELDLFEALSQQLGRDKAKIMVQYMEAKIDKRLEENTRVFFTKEDIAKLETKIAESEARITMRMFYFWIGQVAVVAGLLTYFFKFSGH